MDIDLPKVSGIEGVKKAKYIFPDAEIIMNTVFDDEERIFQAIKNGASGYILKKVAFTELINAINDVLNGGAPMSPGIARKVINFHKLKLANHEALSTREFQIVEDLSKGLSYKMIADKHSISIETVRSHCKKIYRKLHVNSATEAINKLYH
jgi:DNA-binding NarL/FixJ family response regulator